MPKTHNPLVLNLDKMIDYLQVYREDFKGRR